jgi:hypothetical protein
MDALSKDGAAIIKDLATVAALVIGGAWAFWRWSLSEYIRRRSEMPSFEGEITAYTVKAQQGRVTLSVSCKWKSLGGLPLDVNTQETRFTVYRIPDDLPPGPIGPRLKNLPELYVRRPWEHWPAAVLEPGTNSQLQAHFLVEPEQTLVVACRLEALHLRRKQKQVWVRELVCHTSAAAANDA